jgi:hypothetical protein
MIQYILGCRSAAFLQKLPLRPWAKSSDTLRATVVLTQEERRWQFAGGSASVGSQ